MAMHDYKFGECIFNLRTKEGLSQAQLAKKLGVSDKAISKWENGKAKPRVEMLKKLSNVLNIAVGDSN